jgi:hypothetical protein
MTLLFMRVSPGVQSFDYSGAMSEKPTLKIAVVMERVAIESRWAKHQWRVASVRPDCGGEPRVVVEHEGLLQKLHPGLDLTIHRDEAEGYYLNVSSEQPAVFVSWRADEAGEGWPFLATLSYHEAARWMDGGETVDRVEAPVDLIVWIGTWVEENYRPEVKKRIRPKSFESLERRSRDT